MTQDAGGVILLFSRGVRILRGPKAEEQRRGLLRLRRRAAFNRAVHGGYNDADRALCGSETQLMIDGPEWPELIDDADASAAS